MNRNGRVLFRISALDERDEAGRSRALSLAGDVAGHVAGLPFRVLILDLNQIKGPRAQTMVVQALLRRSRSGDWYLWNKE